MLAFGTELSKGNVVRNVMILLFFAVASYASWGYEPYAEADSPESDYFFSGIFGMLYLLIVLGNAINSFLTRKWKLFFILFIPALIIISDLYLVIFSYGTFSYMFHKTAILVLQTNLISWGIVELTIYLYTKAISFHQTNETEKKEVNQLINEVVTPGSESTDYKDLPWEFGIDPSIHKRNS